MNGLILSLGILFFVNITQASSMIYVPEQFKPKTAKIVVVIHGCLQTPESMALGTGWNQKADQNNLVIIYPQVPTGSNPIDCWSWYEPAHQIPTSGQLRQIHSEVLKWKKVLKIKKAPVYLTGISSGAAMVSGLLACFPRDFAAGAIHSGPSYGLASNLLQGDDLLKNGPSDQIPVRACDPTKFKKPVMVIQGMNDQVVNPLNINAIIRDFLGEAYAGRTEFKNSNGLNYKVKTYLRKGSRRIAGRVVTVDGLGHAWAGYTKNLRHPLLLGPKQSIPTVVPFFTDSGPSSTNLIFDFFSDVEKGSYWLVE